MLIDHIPCRHAEKRFNQRGLRNTDVELVLDSASRVAPDAYLLTNRDVEREISRRKQEIQRLEKLRGTKLVVDGDTLITAYHSRPSDQKRTFRKGRDYK